MKKCWHSSDGTLKIIAFCRNGNTEFECQICHKIFVWKPGSLKIKEKV